MIENTCIQCEKHFRSKRKQFFCDACKKKHLNAKNGLLTLAVLASPFIKGKLTKGKK
ncbi:hypothetical protein ADO06_01257 [Streptococcus parauberis]|nr:hypothetical protein ADO06_01257 [Streptococcus parauberis]